VDQRPSLKEIANAGEARDKVMISEIKNLISPSLLTLCRKWRECGYS
jgi:hypothetical protein